MVLKVWSVTSSISISWKLVRNADSWAPPKTKVLIHQILIHQPPLAMNFSCLYFNKPPGDFEGPSNVRTIGLHSSECPAGQYDLNKNYWLFCHNQHLVFTLNICLVLLVTVALLKYSCVNKTLKLLSGLKISKCQNILVSSAQTYSEGREHFQMQPQKFQTWHQSYSSDSD